MSQVALFYQLLVRTRFVQGVEILPVQVLHQGLLEAHGVIGLMNECRNGLQPGPTGGPKTALARDQLEFLGPHLTHEDRLENTYGFDRVDESRKPLFPELVAGLVRVGADSGERDLSEHRPAGGPRGRWDERTEPLTQTATPDHR